MISIGHNVAFGIQKSHNGLTFIQPERCFAMTTYFVTRHPGARAWATQEGFNVDKIIHHLDSTIIMANDIVIGSLPVNLAAEVCARGGRYLHLSLDLPPQLRGVELTADDMRNCGARLEEFRVARVPFNREAALNLCE